jgi:hypothetical protein
MKILALCSFLIVISGLLSGQNLIGYNNNEIRKFMKENRKEMNFSNVRNSTFSYLKYSDNADKQTILFFLAPDSVCKSIRLICDSTMKPEKLSELNAKYKNIGDDRWIDQHGGKNYLIELRDEKWSCTITIERAK